MLERSVSEDFKVGDIVEVVNLRDIYKKRGLYKGALVLIVGLSSVPHRRILWCLFGGALLVFDCNEVKAA